MENEKHDVAPESAVEAQEERQTSIVPEARSKLMAFYASE